MEGLLPEVSATRNGLANKQNVRFKMSRGEEDRWFHLATSSAEKISFLVSSSAASEADKLFYISLVSHQLSLSPYGKAYRVAGSGSNGFLLYSRKTEGKVDYYVHITSNWIGLRIMSIYTDIYSSILADQIEAPNIEELTEIPIQSIGG